MRNGSLQREAVAGPDTDMLRSCGVSLDSQRNRIREKQESAAHICDGGLVELFAIPGTCAGCRILFEDSGSEPRILRQLVSLLCCNSQCFILVLFLCRKTFSPAR